MVYLFKYEVNRRQKEGSIMPYKSKAQMRYFHANRKKLERQGVDVDEWDKKSKGRKLPERARKSKKK